MSEERAATSVKSDPTSPRARRPTLGPRVVIRFHPDAPLSDALFAGIAAENDLLRLERNARGELEVMAPAGTEGGGRNFRLNGRFSHWVENKGRGLGIGFDSSTGFTLPSGAILSPDSSWVAQDRWNALTPEQRKGFAHVCPDFVVELRSDSDKPSDLRKKMGQYILNGARLGWLIDPLRGKVEIYRPGLPVEKLDRPASLSGEGVLPGFVLDLNEILGP